MHLKREASPKSWPVERKGTKYLVRPNYNIEKGVPILIVIRDMLKFADNRREVKKALNSKQVLLNKKVVFNDKENALLFDVVTLIPKKESNMPEKNYRVFINRNKKFDLEEISGGQSGHKTAKVVDKKTLKGGKTQINLSDGRNFISDMKCNANDSVLLNLKDKKIEKCIPLKTDSKAVVFAGKHAGETGTITEIDRDKNRVKLDSDGKQINILIKQLMVLE